MDLVENLMDKEGGDIVSELTSRDLSAEQVNEFSPETLAALMQYLKDTDFVDLFGPASSNGFDSLLSSTDITALLGEDCDFG
ncbi:MAG: hypothetical protein ABF290_11545 [Thiogranum sp.]|jgi:Mg/Co/Ni transporter MgtE